MASVSLGRTWQVVLGFKTPLRSFVECPWTWVSNCKVSMFQQLRSMPLLPFSDPIALRLYGALRGFPKTAG